MTLEVRDLDALKAKLAACLRERMASDQPDALDPDAALAAVDRAIAAAGVDDEDAVDLWQSFLEVIEKIPDAAALDESDFADMIKRMTAASG